MLCITAIKTEHQTMVLLRIPPQGRVYLLLWGFFLVFFFTQVYVLLRVNVFFLEEVSLYAGRCHFDYLYVRKSHFSDKNRSDPNMQHNILRNSISLQFLYYSYLVLFI